MRNTSPRETGETEGSNKKRRIEHAEGHRYTIWRLQQETSRNRFRRHGGSQRSGKLVRANGKRHGITELERNRRIERRERDDHNAVTILTGQRLLTLPFFIAAPANIPLQGARLAFARRRCPKRHCPRTQAQLQLHLTEKRSSQKQQKHSGCLYLPDH